MFKKWLISKFYLLVFHRQEQTKMMHLGVFFFFPSPWGVLNKPKNSYKRLSKPFFFLTLFLCGKLTATASLTDYIHMWVITQTTFKALFSIISMIFFLNEDFSHLLLLVAIKTCSQVSWLTIPNPYLTTLLNIIMFKGTFLRFLNESLTATRHRLDFLLLTAPSAKRFKQLIRTGFQKQLRA